MRPARSAAARPARAVRGEAGSAGVGRAPARRDAAKAAYHLRIARPRPRGSVDIGHELIRASTAAGAVARAAALMDRAWRSGLSGVAMLTDGQGCLIWTHRGRAGPARADDAPEPRAG